MKGTVRLNIRKDKVKKDDTAPIEAIYSLKGIRKYINTGISVDPIHWDAENEIIQFFSKKIAEKLYPEFPYTKFLLLSEIDPLNTKLSILREQFRSAESYFESISEPYSSETIVNRVKELAGKKQLAEKVDKKIYFDTRVEERILVFKPKRAVRTVFTYERVLKQFKAFQKKARKRYQIKEVDKNVLERFSTYLLDEGFQDGTIHTSIKTIKTFLNDAKTNGLETSVNYHKLTIKLKGNELEPITLSQTEFDAVCNVELDSALDKVRDVFVFSCVTGLRASDLAQLNRTHIKDDHIKITPIKTDKELSIPLNKISNDILHKYRHQLKKALPVLSEAYLNREIKEICKLAGITDQIEIHSYKGGQRETETVSKHQAITLHTGRRTFISLLMAKGLDAETIRRYSGHKDVRAFSRYVNIEKSALKDRMQTAFGSLGLKVAGVE